MPGVLGTFAFVIAIVSARLLSGAALPAPRLAPPPVLTLPPPPPPPLCRTSAFGAVPSTTSYSTAALQAAINACSGPPDSCGTVLVDLPGSYLTASLLLTGCVHLVLPPGVRLLAGTQRWDYATHQEAWYLLLFHNCSGCSLSGGGTVDGQAQRWVLPGPAAAHAGGPPTQQQQAGGELWRSGRQAGRQLQGEGQRLMEQLATPQLEVPRKAVRNWDDPSCAKPEECRPRLVGVLDSSHVSIQGVTLTDPIYWCLHVLRSRHVALTDLTIRGDWGIPNNDGIDIDSSSHVSVVGADVDTADDAICLKTTQPAWPLEHVLVQRCRLRSRSSAVKLGSESVANMRHITFERLEVTDAHRGLAIQLRDGGSISHVRFQHITLSTRYTHPSWWGAAEPMHITALPRRPGVQVGHVSNITFTDIMATAENGVFIAGGPLPVPPHTSGSSTCCAHAVEVEATAQRAREQQQCSGQHSISGVVLKRLRLRLQKRSHWAGGCQDYRPSSNSSGSSSNSSGSSSSNMQGCAGSTGVGGIAPCWWPAGLDCSHGRTLAVWVAGADQVLLSDVQIEYCRPWRADWEQELHIDAGSTSGVNLRRVHLRNSSCTC